MSSSLSTTELDAGTAVYDEVVAAGDGALITVPAGGELRIVDLHGNQAVDTLLYDAHDVRNRYSAFDTVREQRRNRPSESFMMLAL